MPIVNRRRLLATLGSSVAVGGLARPLVSRAADRPVVTHGVQSGDVSVDSGVVWARADRASRMMVEVSTTESFATIHSGGSTRALPENDFAAKVLLENLPPGQDIFYRVRFADLWSTTVMGDPVTGRFRTAPSDRRSVSFVWSGDTVGQGWGIDEARGGMRTYAAMQRNRPDFFIHSGDTVYADVPLQREVLLPDGSFWRNLVTEEKSKPAETLAEFRGNFKYNLLDRNLRAFNAEVPMFAQWDDHEVSNNWWPDEDLTGAKHRRLGYRETNASVLMQRASRAFHEFLPIRRFAGEADRIYRRISYGPLLDVFMLDMRSYRGPNGENREDTYGPASHLFGPQQIAWLKRELQNSRAIWKVIAADQPLGVIIYEDFMQKIGAEGIGLVDGPPLGRELELADLLAFIKRAGVRNTVWVTADVHYTAAHYYDSNKAVFQDFEPFWEFVSGPIHAGCFGPGGLDNTFGPQLMYVKAPPPELGQGLSPATSYQFFGHVAIDGASGVMTVTLKDVDDRALWSTRIEPRNS
jgi:alkaline phosphatase D